jgi:hypothetical protein
MTEHIMAKLRERYYVDVRNRILLALAIIWILSVLLFLLFNSKSPQPLSSLVVMFLVSLLFAALLYWWKYTSFRAIFPFIGEIFNYITPVNEKLRIKIVPVQEYRIHVEQNDPRYPRMLDLKFTFGKYSTWLYVSFPRDPMPTGDMDRNSLGRILGHPSDWNIETDGRMNILSISITLREDDRSSLVQDLMSILAGLGVNIFRNAASSRGPGN